jgi:methionine synthase I (cobalamin-dependent)
MRFDRQTSQPLRLDGAIGTELVARGLSVRAEPAELWNVTRPEEVRAVHAAYAAAGVDVIQTNTFGALAGRLGKFGLAARRDELIRTAVALAREAAPGRAVVGSLGPIGEPVHEGLAEDYAAAARCLAGAGVDAIHLETQLHPAELAAAVDGIRRGAEGLPLIVSVTLTVGASGLETPLGVPLPRMVKALDAADPDAVGVNCSLDAERMRPAVVALRAATDRPIWAKPQAKVSQKCAAGESRETAARFVARGMELVRAGATAIGGCCGIGPALIAALGDALRDGAGLKDAAGGEPAELEEVLS